MVRVFVPGVFDVFHVGHLNYLRHAAQYGKHLIVGVQDDRAVATCKGIRPVVPLAERMEIIANLRFVDEVVSYVAVDQSAVLEGLNIDVFACGEEYGATDQYPDQKTTLEYCRRQGIHVARIARTPHVSSTQIRDQLRQFWNDRARLAGKLEAGVTVLGSFDGDQEKVREETRREVELVLAAVERPEDKVLLDLGCGDGRLLVPLAAQFGDAIGVDYASKLLDLAEKRLRSAGQQACLIEGGVSDLRLQRKADVVLLSGLLPCLDDLMAQRLLGELARCTHSRTQLLVRTSLGTQGRIDVINQYSPELRARYTAYYRTREEIVALLRGHGWREQASCPLYQHRTDSAVWWFEFSTSGETSSANRLAELVPQLS